MQISYEDAAFKGARSAAAQLSAQQRVHEVYRGRDMTEWWGAQGRVIDQKIKEYSIRSDREAEIKELKAFQEIWRTNRLDGSLKAATLNALYTAASMGASRDTLDTADYFSRMRDHIGSVLAANWQEVPTVPSSTDKVVPGGGLGGKGARKPTPPVGNFAAQDKAPKPDGVNPPGKKEPLAIKPGQPAAAPPS